MLRAAAERLQLRRQAPPLTAPSPTEPAVRRERFGLRWTLPIALLAVEYLALAAFVELPPGGPTARLAASIRLALPIALGGGVGAWLLTRHGPRPVDDAAHPLPAWRPWPALVAQLTLFGATAAAGVRLLGRPGEVAPAPLAAWLAAVAACVVLAVASAAPLRWTLRFAARRWRIQILALALGLLTWWVLGLAESLWGALAGGTLRAVAALVGLFPFPVTVDAREAALSVGAFELEIAPTCSGVDGVGLILLFLGIWMATQRSRLRLRRALLLLPLGVVAALAANVVRIAALALLGAWGWEDLAAGGFHTKLGWLLFVGIALGIMALAERVPWFQGARSAAGPADGGVPHAAAAYLAPLLAALAIALVSGLWAEGPFDRAYALRIAAAAIALASFRRLLPKPSLSWSWVNVGIAAVVCAIWLALARSDGAALARSVSAMEAPERWAWIVARVVGSCLVIPLVEELAFRGFLLPWLVSPDFENVSARTWTWPAVLLSSLAFGLLHERWVAGFVAGLAFAGARLWRGRLGDAVAAHALCNAGIAAAVLLGGRWGLWS